MSHFIQSKNEKILTLAISTIYSNLDNILKYLEKIPKIDNIEIIVICQVFDSKSLRPSIENIHYKNELTIYSYQEKGISNSRNRAIEKSNSIYIWFLDDDIQLNIESVYRLISHLHKSKNDCEIVKIGSLEDNNKFYKNYNSRNFGLCREPIKLLQVSSIEIIIKRKSILDKKITFNPSFGLGTKYPAGEENLFLLDLFSNKLSINFIDITPIKHTTITTHRLKKSKEHYQAQGYISSKFPFYIRFPLIIRWSLRKNQEIPFIKRIKYIFSGKSIMGS